MAERPRIAWLLMAVPLLGVALLLGFGARRSPGRLAETTGVTIERLEVQAANVNPSGRIWGEFRVAVTVRNLTGRRMEARKVVVDYLANNDRYPKLAPDRQSQVGTVPGVAPGETAAVTVGTFRTAHPELAQEVVANVLAQDGEPGAVRKKPVASVFPPGSQD